MVVQRVSEAKVDIEGRTGASIGPGLLVLLGIEGTDEREDADWLVKKLMQMRIFSDAEGKMNLSILDTGGSVIVVSQFTLHASTKKGNRPSFIRAAGPQQAIPLYEYLSTQLTALLGPDRVGTGQFGADMKVSLCNDGPVTIIIDSKARE